MTGRVAAHCFVWPAALLLLGCAATQADAPGSSLLLYIDHLRTVRFANTLEIERELEPTDSYRAYLASYRSTGLTVYALVAVPLTPKPPAGYPVLVANHGYHPDPPRYGISPDGTDRRPGDYYRAIPDVYAREGFLVVMPDFRGHNVSEGLAYTESFLATRYYTLDVLALLAGLPSIEQADTTRVFMWGHSMGGDVTLRAAQIAPGLRAISLWSPVTVPAWEVAYRFDERDKPDTLQNSKTDFDRLQQEVADLEPPHDPVHGEPLEHLHHLTAPVMVQHARGDASVPYAWAERLAAALYRQRVPYVFHTYESDDHLFAGDEMAAAVARDVAFFRRAEVVAVSREHTAESK